MPLDLALGLHQESAAGRIDDGRAGRGPDHVRSGAHQARVDAPVVRGRRGEHRLQELTEAAELRLRVDGGDPALGARGADELVEAQGQLDVDVAAVRAERPAFEARQRLADPQILDRRGKVAGRQQRAGADVDGAAFALEHAHLGFELGDLPFLGLERGRIADQGRQGVRGFLVGLADFFQGARHGGLLCAQWTARTRAGAPRQGWWGMERVELARPAQAAKASALAFSCSARARRWRSLSSSVAGSGSASSACPACPSTARTQRRAALTERIAARQPSPASA